MRHTWPMAALWLALAASGAAADDFPTRPVTMVVPFAAGGPIDLLGRIIQPALAQALGPDYLARYVASEMTRWAPAVRASGAGVE